MTVKDRQKVSFIFVTVYVPLCLSAYQLVGHSWTSWTPQIHNLLYYASADLTGYDLNFLFHRVLVGCFLSVLLYLVHLTK